jgi:hypothetical protein
VEEVGGDPIGLDDTSLEPRPLLLARPHLFVVELEGALACDPLDRFGERKTFDLLDELVDVAAFLTAEAMEQSRGRVHREGRGLFRMKGTEAFEGVRAGLLKRRVSRDDVDEVGPIPEGVDVVFFYLRHEPLLRARKQTVRGSRLILIGRPLPPEARP